ncbi:MAG TPA: LAGLIDADG family homing endonuclease [Candidatus Saccharimonadales bacterium]|nr:LAGLIDADG family homing endonuclease [Candidatus Saccharimonadales bacterium]
MRYKPKHYYTWSANIAYTVGLIASDGCLQKDQRHIDLTSVDMEQLNNFRLAIGRPLPITKKFNGTGQPAFRIQFSDGGYYDFLLAAGLTPAKSKTISQLTVPDQYYADFLRGLFDGDGSCYGYMDPRWRSSFMFYVAFTSASLDFIHYLRAANSRICGVTPGSIRKSTRAYALVYAKNDSHKLYHFMYYAPGLLCLTRKHKKLLAFTRRDRAGIISTSSASGEMVNTLP